MAASEESELRELMDEEDQKLTWYYKTRFHLTFFYNYSLVHHFGFFTGLKW